MKQVFLMLLLLGVGTQSFAEKSTRGSFYTDVNKMELDPKLPEPFARTKTAQVILNYDEHDATLIFTMSDSEGIEVTFPITSDATDNCNNRTIIATPPSNSTPYYKDFEIKVVDSSDNTCDSVNAAAPTVATLRSYEVGSNSKTLSTLFGGKLQKFTPTTSNH
ncbi:MAG: hypothetical protein ACXVB1_05695 [Pseudobdellovibrionaceae bacterium]